MALRKHDGGLALDSLPRAPALGDRVYDSVRKFLREGNIRPGDKLRSQFIASRLGVSQTPVREALLRLAQEGLVIAAGRGFEVPLLDRTEFLNLFELRKIIEPRAFASVARTGDLSGMAKCSRLGLEAHRSGNVAAFARANTAFRQQWFDQVANPKMVSAMRLYDDHLVHVRRLSHESLDGREIMMTGHAELVAAVEARDPRAAEEAMNRNLQHAEEVMLTVLHRQGER